MAFKEMRFPEVIGLGAEGGPEYMTDIVSLVSGWEQRNIVQSSPLQRYTVSFVNRPTTEFETLVAFFRIIKGRAHGFRFKDYLDFQVPASQGVLTLIAGSPSNHYQMYKRYTSGGETDDRKITKPVSGTVSIYEAGLPMGSGYSIDHTTGIVYIAHGSPAGPFTFACDFDVPVRLGTDLMKPSMLNIGNDEILWTWDGIELVELRQ